MQTASHLREMLHFEEYYKTMSRKNHLKLQESDTVDASDIFRRPISQFSENECLQNMSKVTILFSKF